MGKVCYTSSMRRVLFTALLIFSYTQSAGTQDFEPSMLAVESEYRHINLEAIDYSWYAIDLYRVVANLPEPGQLRNRNGGLLRDLCVLRFLLNQF